MRGRLFLLHLLLLNEDFPGIFFFSIPTVELSNKRADKTPRSPTKVTTWASPSRSTDLSLQSFPINQSKIPSSPKGRTWIYFVVKQQDLPALARLLGASKSQFLKLRFSSSFPATAERQELELGIGNWNFCVKVAHPVPDFSTKFTSWSQTLNNKEQTQTTLPWPPDSWLKLHPGYFPLESGTVVPGQDEFMSKGDVIRDYCIIYFSSLAHHHSLGLLASPAPLSCVI